MGKFSFLKQYLVSILLFMMLFLLGFYVKSYVGDFFSSIDTYQTEIQALEPGLANQSTEALLALDPLVGDFESAVLKAFLIFLVITPLLVYLFVNFAEAYFIAEKWKSFRYQLYAFLLGLPILLVFYFLMNNIFESFANSFMSWKALVFFILYLVLISLLCYVWYCLVYLLRINALKKWKLFYKKAGILYFLFLPFYIIYLFLFGYLVYFLVSIMTKSFLGGDFWIYLIIFLTLLLFLTISRSLFLHYLIKKLN